MGFSHKAITITLSVLIVVLSVALIIGGTYALYTDQATVTNHLNAGELEVTLARTALTTKTIDNSTGLLKETVYPDEEVDFTESNKKNVFEIDDDTKIIPGSKFDASMKIKNGGTVAFAYWIEIKFSSEVSSALAEQIKVTITTADGNQTAAFLSSGLVIGSAGTPIGMLLTRESTVFDVCIEFLELGAEVNDAAQGKSVDFDLVVHAVQVVDPAAKPAEAVVAAEAAE